MKKSYIYVLCMLVLSVVYIAPNLDYLLSDISSLKQQPNISSQTEEAQEPNSEPLPSFLESSSGVLESTNIGLTGSADPTVPLTYTDELVEQSLQNDLDIYGIEMDDSAKQELMNKVLGNSELDANITNNATNNTSETVSVAIKVVKSLLEFCES